MNDPRRIVLQQQGTARGTSYEVHMARLPNSSEPAFPVAGWSSGLTKREYFAALMMQALSVVPEWNETPEAQLATMAVNHADALLAELTKPAN